jgi:hypothetical protein
MRITAGVELHAKMIRQDLVVLHEIGKRRLFKPREAEFHPSLERHGRRNRVGVPVPQGEEASVCQPAWRHRQAILHSLTEVVGYPVVDPQAFPIGRYLIDQLHPIPAIHR